jgi:hypothetical protein
MVGWREIYAGYLKAAGEMYLRRDLEGLERLLDIMEGAIFDERALAEVRGERARLEEAERIMRAGIEAEAKRETHPLRRARILAGLEDLRDWRLRETLRAHQRAAKKYGLVEE